MRRQLYSPGTSWQPVVGYSRAVRVEVARLIDQDLLVEIEADAVIIDHVERR